MTGLRAQTWDGGETDSFWGTKKNWSPNTAPRFTPTTDLTFAGSVRTASEMNGNRTASAVTLAAGAAAFSLLGFRAATTATLSVDGTGAGITQASVNDQTLTMNRISWGAAALSGQFFGTGNLTKTGLGGALGLNGPHANWTGALAMNQGIVEARTSGSASGGGAGTTMVVGGAAWPLARINHTFLKKSFCHRAHRGPNRGHGAKHLVRSVASVGWAPCPLWNAFGQVGCETYGLGPGGLVKEGSGELRLTSPIGHTFTGATVITARSIVPAASNPFNHAAAMSVGNGTLLSLNNFTPTLGRLSGGGTVDFDAGGTGQLVLSGGAGLFDRVFPGTDERVIRAGATLTLGTNFSAPNLTIALAGGTLGLNGTTATFGNLPITGDSLLDFGDSTAWPSFAKQVTPVPEPGVDGGMLVGAAGALVAWRRGWPARPSGRGPACRDGLRPAARGAKSWVRGSRRGFSA